MIPPELVGGFIGFLFGAITATAVGAISFASRLARIEERVKNVETIVEARRTPRNYE